MRRVFWNLLPWLLPGIALLAWYIAGIAGWLPDKVLPTPGEVVRAFTKLAASGELARHVAVSCRRAAIGFAAGSSIGLLLGLLSGTSRTAEKLLDTSVQMLRTVPHLALIPLVILWFGVGETAKIFLVALGVAFPIYLNTHHGFRTVDPELIEMGRVYGLGPWGLFQHVLLPGALPAILVGIRYALGVMWLTLIVAETIAATSGVGYLAMNAREFLQVDVVVLSILLYAGFGKLADVAARLLERVWLPWHPSFVDDRSESRDPLVEPRAHP
ncbi:MAG: aliphatic sulfonate ABC transporter permease SsuC [Planctomycetota bacterium]|nr:aliphatic sulfonate ABC transporter permease SsuC [Planctomycetota bacterium]